MTEHNREIVLCFVEDLTKTDEYTDNTTIKISDKHFFNEYRNWCTPNGVKNEMNNIPFGLKLSQIMKKNINKNFECIMKDTNNNTIIHIQETKAFLES